MTIQKRKNCWILISLPDEHRYITSTAQIVMLTSGNGYYPTNRHWLKSRRDPSSLINMTLNGSLRLVSSEGPVTTNMPYFRLLLNDQQIADVLSYVRSSWGNSASVISAEDVAEVRAATDPTQNDDIFVLRMK